MADTSLLIESDTLLEWAEYIWYVGGSFGLMASCLAACNILQPPLMSDLPADVIGSWACLA